MFSENIDKDPQDLEKSFHDAGQFYWGKRSAWMNEERILDQTNASIYSKI